MVAMTIMIERMRAKMTEGTGIIGCAVSLWMLARKQQVWSEATFGSDQERGPLGVLKHLEKEAREAQQAVGTPEIRMELADCFLLLLDASRRAGMDVDDLIVAAREKHEINRMRAWMKPVDDEPVEHVRSDDDSE
jgi:hypothetical protein